MNPSPPATEMGDSQAAVGTPLRVALIYLGAGVLWVVGTDLAIYSEIWTSAAVVLEIGKGCLFVALSAVLIYLLLRQEMAHVVRSAKLLEAVISGTSDAVFVKDREGRYLLCNQAAGDFVGRPPREVVGSLDSSFFDADSARKIRQHDERVIESGVGYSLDETLTANGVTRVYNVTKSPYRDADGRILGVVGIARDITVRNRTEQELRQAEAQIRAIGDNLPNGAIYRYQRWPDGRKQVLFVSRGAERLFGVTVEEAYNRPELLTLMTAPEEAAVAEAAELESMERLTPFDLECHFHAPNGEFRQMHWRSAPSRQADGSTIWDGVVLDVTARYHAQEQIRQLSLAVEQCPATIVITDRTGTIQYANPAFSDITGYSIEEAVGKNPRLLKSGRMSEEFYREMWATLLAGQVWRGELLNRKKDGSLYWESAVIAPVVDATGTTTHYVAVKEDITRRKLAEEDLRASEQRLQAVLNRLFASVAMLDREGSVLWMNDAPLEAAGLNRTDILGKKFWEAGFWEDDEPGRLAVQTAVARAARGEQSRFDISSRSKSGQRRFIDFQINALRNEAGEILYLIPTAIDITARKQYELALRRSEEQFRAFMEHSPVAAWITDENARIEYLSGHAQIILGTSTGDLPGKSLTDLIAPPNPEGFTQRIRQVSRTGEVLKATETLCRSNDSFREMMVYLFPLPRPDGSTAVGGIAADLTDLRHAEERLRVLGAAIDSSPNAVFIADRSGVIRWANPAFSQLSGYSLEEAIGQTPRLLRSGHQGSGFYRGLWDVITSGRVWTGELVERHKSGREYVVRPTITPLAGPDGLVDQFVAVQEDITAHKHAEARLRDLAVTDTLTGLLNRAGFRERMEGLLTGGMRALHFVDLDHFKVINDSLGHLAGDDLLRQVAERIQHRIRGADVAARLGGDEFAILQTVVSDAGAAGALARGLLEVLSHPFHLLGEEVQLGASIGVTLFPDDGADVETLLKNADLAMYRAKQDGRGTFRFFTTELEQQVQARLALESEIRRGLERGEFQVYYQPQVLLADERVIAAEALIRWQHPTQGLLSPANFLSVAEESGLILPLGEWVLQTACRQGRRWLDAGRPTRVAVNITVAQFQRGDLLRTVRDTLEATGFPAEYLELELTENLLLPDVPEADRLLAQLHDLGVKLAIDDFGTGYSSLSYLRRLPVDRLKIDRSFVLGIPTNPRDATLVRAITGLGHDLGLQVIAEGVETPEQLAFLRECGCDEAQGYFFGRPTSAQAVEALLRPQRGSSTAGETGPNPPQQPEDLR